MSSIVHLSTCLKNNHTYKQNPYSLSWHRMLWHNDIIEFEDVMISPNCEKFFIWQQVSQAEIEDNMGQCWMSRLNWLLQGQNSATVHILHIHRLGKGFQQRRASLLYSPLISDLYFHCLLCRVGILHLLAYVKKQTIQKWSPDSLLTTTLCFSLDFISTLWLFFTILHWYQPVTASVTAKCCSMHMYFWLQLVNTLFKYGFLVVWAGKIYFKIISITSCTLICVLNKIGIYLLLH